MMNNDPARRTPLISVIMPVYEPHSKFFPKAIESILAQRLADWELIVVEDPSARSAAETLRSFCDPRICHIANPRRTSLVDQRNLGLSRARGRFIAMMDADDIAHPFRLVKQLNFLRSHADVGVVGSHVAVIDAADRLAGYRWFPVLHDDILRAATRVVPLCQPAVMLRREIFEEFGGYQFVEFAAAEDYDYWSRLLQSGVRFANVPEPLLYYRIHHGQIKLSRLRETIRAVLRVKQLHWSNRLDLRGRLQARCERLLLHLPARFVSWLLLRLQWHFRPRPNAPRINLSNSS